MVVFVDDFRIFDLLTFLLEGSVSYVANFSARILT